MTYDPVINGAFADVDANRSRQRRGFEGAATIEVAHATTRNGFILRVDGCTSPQQVNRVLDSAFEIGARLPHPRITSPGWWALVVGIAAAEHFPSELMRVNERAKLHCCMVVERPAPGVVDARPDWPMTRIGPTGYWTDHRGERALARPSRSDLVDYARRAGLPETAGTYDDLVRAFDMGVLEFESALPRFGGRRRLVHA